MLKAFAYVGGAFRHNPWFQITLALGISACLIANYLAPVALRFQWRALDAPVLFASLLLFSLWAYFSAALISERWSRFFARGLSLMVGTLAIAGFLFRSEASPVATTSIGSDKVVASWMVGGAAGPHYTEFRQERSLLPGFVLVRTIGYCNYLGDVTLSFVPPHSVHAVVTDNISGWPHVIDMRVSPLLSW